MVEGVHRRVILGEPSTEVPREKNRDHRDGDDNKKTSTENLAHFAQSCEEIGGCFEMLKGSVRFEVLADLPNSSMYQSIVRDNSIASHLKRTDLHKFESQF